VGVREWVRFCAQRITKAKGHSGECPVREFAPSRKASEAEATEQFYEPIFAHSGFARDGRS